MSKLSEKAKEEALALIPPTLFFLVALNLVAIFRDLMLHGTGIKLDSWLSVSIGALILAKAVLIADLLPIINRYPSRPLAFNVAWKATIYVVMATFIHYLERLYDYWKEAGGLVAGNEKMLAEMVWTQFWAIHLLLAVLIVMYCTMSELVRVIGPTKVRHMFFGPVEFTPGS